jgi:hypothetical protein
MPNYRRRVLIIVATSIISSVVIMWLTFGLHIWRFFGQNRAIYLVLALVVVLPIFVYYPMAKRMPRLAIALAVLSGGLVLISVGTIAFFVFNVENVLTDRIFDLGKALCALASLIFIWRAVKESRAKRESTKIAKYTATNDAKPQDNYEQ